MGLSGTRAKPQGVPLRALLSFKGSFKGSLKGNSEALELKYHTSFKNRNGQERGRKSG